LHPILKARKEGGEERKKRDCQRQSSKRLQIREKYQDFKKK
jgi:hypothetical protein